MPYDPTTGAYIPDAGTPAVGAQPTTQISTPAQIGQQFTFDASKYLPQIQQQAASIYSPQVAQLQALQKLGQTQTEQAKVTTNEQFAKQLQSEIEAINARGAFFGGGAIQRQGDIGTEQRRALTAIELQQQAAAAQTQGQLGQLGAAQTQYIQEQLQGRQASAYQQFQDQQQALIQERAYQQSVREADRSYNLQLKQIKAQKKANKISAKEAKKAKKQAKKQYEESKSQFQQEMAYKYAALNKPSGSSQKGSAYIDSQGNVVELPSGYNYIGGTSQLNKDNNEPIF